MHSIYLYAYLDMTSPLDPPYIRLVRQQPRRKGPTRMNMGLGELHPRIPVDEPYHLHWSSIL
ncbi:hypothetical protein Hanom_Chr14g01267741 [Helianthus anomalus]